MLSLSQELLSGLYLYRVMVTSPLLPSNSTGGWKGESILEEVWCRISAWYIITTFRENIQCPGDKKKKIAHIRKMVLIAQNASANGEVCVITQIWRV